MATLTYADLVKLIKSQNRNFDLDRLNDVYRFAQNAHDGTFRDSGDPYISHPLAVASHLISWHQGQAAIEAALLHDVVEDTSFTLDNIKSKFGSEVAFLVDGVTKVGKVRLKISGQAYYVENLRKMFVAMAKDIRVILIRLADRLHNMQTLDALALDKQKRIALETLEIYAPLAGRLGMGKVKGELEDLAFPYVYPKEHAWVSSLASTHLRAARATATRIIHKLKKELTRAHIPAKVTGRRKHLYSLYCKLNRDNIDQDISKVHDLIACRVITKNTIDCYAALGVVHQIYKPAPHLGVSDFIASPKPNGYQSIHTKVFYRTGRIFEIQIRSEEMHRHAEYGAATHSLYSEAKSSGVSSEKLEKGLAFPISNKLSWIQELARWQEQIANNKELVTNLKLDVLSNRIYVFSPKGDVFDLPSASTPVDFAFAIHSDLGLHIQSAKVNGRIASLEHHLENGDLVEILCSKSKRLPSRDWLSFVKTAKARMWIKKYLDRKPNAGLQYAI